MLRIVPIPSSRERDFVRDGIIDGLASSTPTTLRDSIVADLVGWRAEKNPYVRRRKWCMSVLFTRKELRRYADQLLAILGIDRDAGPRAPIAASGRDGTHGHATGGRFHLTGHRAGSDIGWDDWYDFYGFDEEADARGFLAVLLAHGVPAHGPYASIDGHWHVLVDSSYFSN